MLLTALAAGLLLGPAPRIAPAKAVRVDTMVSVGGYRLHLVLRRGSAPVTVIFEAGGGAAADSWAGVDSLTALGTGATVVAYDRAGFGLSDTGPYQLEPAEQIVHLGAALDHLGVPTRRIVVGTSYGGVLAVSHAAMLAERVAALVLVDPMNARFVQATGDFVYGTVPTITAPATKRDSALARMIRTFASTIADPRARDGNLAIPMVVITAGIPWWRRPEIDEAWRASHVAMSAAAPNRRLVVAEGAGHDIAKGRPDTIVEAVRSLVAALRPARPQ